ncbi:IS701 family transposase [Streptomyces sp. NPDC006704]|uniref:IS701 family transposase n=1 Tax=Streptomyces sp. NPDC006704 TaxID=3364760 RepID=UPI0036C4DED5
MLRRTLASLPRADQRRWGEAYVRGLLSVEGKKTMRALAGAGSAGGSGSGNGGGSAEQSLYQFISKSPWGSAPVRAEVARLFDERAQVRAWVVRPLVITKEGRHSVGVQRQFVPQYGRVVNCQRASGIWLASDRASCPVDWRIALPACWSEEAGPRERAAIPDGVGACPPERCAIGSLAEMTEGWGLRARPVVMDLRDCDPYGVCAQLTARQLSFVVRVGAAATGPRGAGRPGLLTALNGRRMPVEWFDHATGTLRATSVGVAQVVPRVRRASARTQELTLLAAWTTAGRAEPDAFWLTNVDPSQPGALFRIAMLGRRVERDLAEVAQPLGLRDFEGRSFRGWHHHMTMVSLAHALRVLGVARPPR